MGMKLIRAKQAELDKRAETLHLCTRFADEITRELAKIDQAFKEIDAVRATIGSKLKDIQTFGIKEFEDYKASLEWIAVYSSKDLAECAKKLTRPLPVAPMKKVVQAQQAEISKLMDQWVNKHLANFPKEIKVGMCFKWKDGSIVEILGPGPQAASYKVKQLRDGVESTTNVWGISPQAGYKYINAT